MAGVVSNRLRNKVIPAYYQRVMLEMVFGQSDSRQNYSSRKYEKELHDLAIKIFQCCAENQLENQISLDIQWIPRSDLERADYISRIVDIDDWQITNSCFEYIDKLWGPHTVDCFANYYNNKVEKFFSRFWNPNSSGRDFFVQNVGE